VLSLLDDGRLTRKYESAVDGVDRKGPMSDAVIENPILNSPFREPSRHWRFGDTGITNEIVGERRVSSYFMPIPASKVRGRQLQLETQWTRDRIEENQMINQIRERVAQWRSLRYPGVTPTTRRLLEYWTDDSRERPLFYCQVEALETAIYLTECADKQGDVWIANELRRLAEDQNPGLYRMAFKMATGTGKTVVMAMLIAWQTLNKQANPRDARFSDAFLIVTPGITIRDRLRVLLPEEPDNYYRARDIVGTAELERLRQARIVITNFHAFQPREAQVASKMTKELLNRGGDSPFVETPDQMVRRVCRGLGTKRQVIVLNDEAHHCYTHRIGGDVEGDVLKGEERREAEQRDRDARVWATGLQAVANKIGVKVVYDLSATPFFLRGSGWPEGTLFGWVVSDFSLIDAIEAGIVKIPRVPVADDTVDKDGPTFRTLWPRIRADLPKKSARATARTGPPQLPAELQAALHALYGNYEAAYTDWESTNRDGSQSTPPVFIIVCNNTSVSKLVYDYVAGWERHLDDDTAIAVPGELPLLSNEEDGRFRDRPRTILIDSTQLESGDAMSADFKAVARNEIDEFKRAYRNRYPGRDADALTDEDLLREVMNTVGKPGKLGEQIRCVVSVSMLTEGWDANTVTHILGVRAFGTQLLCEQVVGRGLRRTSYATNDDGLLEPEYAEVYGVPFSFIPTSGSSTRPRATAQMTRVRALPERAACEIRFPRIIGYRYEFEGERLSWSYTDEHRLVLSTQDVPTETEVAGIVGEHAVHDLAGLRAKREQQIVYALAREVSTRYFPDRPWLFPQLVQATRDWMTVCLVLHDRVFPQLLLLHEKASGAVERIARGIISAERGAPQLIAIPDPADPLGSTAAVDFDTAKPVMVTAADKCHVEYIPADSNWEHVLASRLEGMPEVHAYVKNQGLRFTIPYTFEAESRTYIPDFVVIVDDGHGNDDLLSLVVEVTGQARPDKVERVAVAREQWVPGVNALGRFGRWDFIEITDPWNAQTLIREHLVGVGVGE
jgi:type III restriction enzyme